MDPVEVRYRGRRDVLVARGGRRDGVVGFRWGFEQDGQAREQTSFVLLDDGFLLAQPVLFDGDRRGWWYCDLVTVDDRGDTVEIEDLHVDVLVGPPTASYRVLDLDELADAVASGDVDTSTALAGLGRVQRFLDRRLNRRDDTTPTWPDFPPPAVTAPGWADLPLDWRWEARDGAPPSLSDPPPSVAGREREPGSAG